jgi:secreted Zn-dependent insulinase-like peptidase
VQKWVWEEVAQTSANTFRFLSKSPPIRYTSSLCVAMHKYPPPHIISGTGRVILTSTQRQRHRHRDIDIHTVRVTHIDI